MVLLEQIAARGRSTCKRLTKYNNQLKLNFNLNKCYIFNFIFHAQYCILYQLTIKPIISTALFRFVLFVAHCKYLAQCTFQCTIFLYRSFWFSCIFSCPTPSYETQTGFKTFIKININAVLLCVCVCVCVCVLVVGVQAKYYALF